MAFNLTKFLKGLLISESGTNTPKEIQITPGGTTGTKTTITSSQSTNKTITLPDATDTLVGKNTTDTLANKTLTSPILNNAEINLLLAAEQGSTPTTPAAGYRKFYAKSGGFYDLNSAGVETLLGAGGGGGGSPLTVQDEGTTLSSATTKINFIGAGVTATQPVANEINVTIPGGSGANTALSNLAATTAINSSLVPNSGGLELGEQSSPWDKVHASFGLDSIANSGFSIRNISTDFQKAFYLINNFISTQILPSGRTVNTITYVTNPTQKHSMGFSTAPDSADVNFPGDISIETGNTTNLTGADIYIQTGTVGAGGTRGKIKLDAKEIDVSSKKITNVATPTVGTDAANMAYVLATAGGGGAINLVQSVNSGFFTTSSSSSVDVTNLTLSITTTGGRVRLSLEAFGTSSISVDAVTTSPTIARAIGEMSFLRNASIVNSAQFGTSVTSTAATNSQLSHIVSANSFGFTDIALAAGTYTYSVQVRNVPTTGTSSTVSIFNIKLTAEELK